MAQGICCKDGTVVKLTLSNNLNNASVKNNVAARLCHFYGFKHVFCFSPYTQYIGNLELVVQWYNTVKQTVLEAEYPLIENELRTIDDQLLEAEETFTWQKENYWEYTERMKLLVHDLEQRLQQSKDNIKVIQKIMNSWMEHPLFSRKDNKKEALLNMEDREDTLAKKFVTFQEDDFRIHKLIEVIPEQNNMLISCFDFATHAYQLCLNRV